MTFSRDLNAFEQALLKSSSENIDELREYSGEKHRFTLLQIAIRNFTDLDVEKVLELGADPNFAGEYDLPLLMAIDKEVQFAVPKMLECKADPNMEGTGVISTPFEENPTPLSYALYNSQLEIIEAFLDSGNVTLNEEETERLEGIREEYEEYDSPELTAERQEILRRNLSEALDRKTTEYVEYYISRGLQATSFTFRGLLRYAIFACDKKHVDILLNYKVDIHPDQGDLLLPYALQLRHRKLTDYILTFPLSFNGENDYGDDISLILCMNDDVDTLKKIMKHGFYPELKKGNTIFHWAAYCGAEKIFKHFLSEWHDVINDEGETPMHLACLNGHLNIVNIINSEDKNGTDVPFSYESYTKDKRTPLHYASMRNIGAYLAYYRQKMRNVPDEEMEEIRKEPEYVHMMKLVDEVKYPFKNPMYRVRYGYDNDWMEIVRLLLSHDHDINAKDEFGYTPLYIASNLADHALVNEYTSNDILDINALYEKKLIDEHFPYYKESYVNLRNHKAQILEDFIVSENERMSD